jgi:putative tryptophan/tyrosine transport system substrate-binding protein
MIRRREFITLLGGSAAAWPLATGAQQAAMPVIAIVGDDATVWKPWTEAFVDRLHELGWIEGRNVSIEYRWSEGRAEPLTTIAAEFVEQKVDVIVTYGGAVTTLKQAAPSIPIVFAIAVDPVGIGLVPNLSRPGGNVDTIDRPRRQTTRTLPRGCSCHAPLGHHVRRRLSRRSAGKPGGAGRGAYLGS